MAITPTEDIMMPTASVRGTASGSSDSSWLTPDVAMAVYRYIDSKSGGEKEMPEWRGGRKIDSMTADDWRKMFLKTVEFE